MVEFIPSSFEADFNDILKNNDNKFKIDNSNGEESFTLKINFLL